MLFNETDELLLVRNSYGNSSLWVLPGGGIRPWEEALAAAHREVHEELGVKAEQLEFVVAYHSRAEGKRDAIHMFAGRCTETIQPDNFEIAEARHFELDALPELLSPATARRVAEYRGEAPITGVW